MFKAIEVEATTRLRTGREYNLVAETRQTAISALLELLGKSLDEVVVDPSRTVVRIDESLWTLVSVAASEPRDKSSLRRAGAKHKRVR